MSVYFDTRMHNNKVHYTLYESLILIISVSKLTSSIAHQCMQELDIHVHCCTYTDLVSHHAFVYVHVNSIKSSHLLILFLLCLFPGISFTYRHCMSSLIITSFCLICILNNCSGDPLYMHDIIR